MKLCSPEPGCLGWILVSLTAGQVTKLPPLFVFRFPHLSTAEVAVSPDNLPEMVGGTECQLLPLGKGGTLVFMQITALNRVRGSLREKLTFLPRRWTDGQGEHEMVFTTTNCQGNTNKNHTMRYHPTLAGMAVIKRTRDNSVGEEVQKRAPLCTVGGDVSWYIHYGKPYGVSSKHCK